MLRKRWLLARCEKGVTAVEFALLSPVLIMMVLGIVEFAAMMFVCVILEGATDLTARLGTTGYVPAGQNQTQEIINNIDNITGGLLNTHNIVITTTSYSNFNNIGQNGQGTSGLGNPGDVVVYKVSYPWTVMTPVISAIVGNTINLSANAVVRNEPY